MQDLPNGGGGRTPSPKGASPVGLCGWGGGGGRRCKHWAPGAGDPRYATVRCYVVLSDFLPLLLFIHLSLPVVFKQKV